VKNSIGRRNFFLPVVAVFFLVLIIAACSSSSSTPSAQWETLTTLPAYCSFSDYTPTGQSLLYTGAGNGSFYQYDFPTASNSEGSLSTLNSPPVSMQDYIGFAWSGGYLYFAEGNSMFKYDISGNSWNTSASLIFTHASSETTADDNGHVYSVAEDSSLLKYYTSDDTFANIVVPDDLTHNEPRLAWDPSTGRVYLADYEHTTMYAYNPTDDQFTSLKAFPDSHGVSDAFCSDRQGHIYTTTAANTSTSTEVWVYTESSDSWSQFSPSLPFAHGDSAACTISADGYLYFTNGETGQFARIKIF